MQQEVIEGFQLSPQQKRLWLLQQGGHSLPYRASCAVLIEGNLHTEVFKAALEHVVNRHEILRTTFRCLPGMTIPLQVIADSSIPSVQDYELSGLDPREQEAKIEALFHEASRLPFDFEHGPLLRLSLVNLSPHRHILLVSLPALCVDAVTLRNLVREISRSYAACSQGEELTDELMQYADISAILNELLESEEMETGREYWSKQDPSTVVDLKLPFENGSCEKLGFKPEFLTLTINPDTVREIEAFVRKHNGSTCVFLLACWQILLWRLTGQSDIIVGAACDGRTHEELKEALALLARYLPLQCHLDENFRFSEILEQVKESSCNINEWQDYFAWRQTSQSTRNSPESAFFPFQFEFEERSLKHAVGDVSFSIYRQYTCIDRFKIKLSCVSLGESLAAEFHYDANSCQAEDIERLAARFQTLLGSVLNNPEALISELKILNDVERRQLLVEFNDTQTHYCKEKCIHQLFEEQAERTPDNVAVVHEDQQLTYRELDDRANQLAHYLRGLGVGPETLVAICVERSLEMVVGLLGVLKAGGAYVPLDPVLPRNRVAFMLKDTQSPVLLTQHRLLEQLFEDRRSEPVLNQVEGPDPELKVVCLDTDWNVIAGESAENPISGVLPENRAYVIYTSGSTGRPKGVMISHEAVCNRLLWAQEAYPLTLADRVLQLASFSFDFSVWEVFGALLAGARVILIGPGQQLDSAKIVKLIAEQMITIVHFVPSMLEILLEEHGLESCISLRRVFCGGEPLPYELQDRFFSRLEAKLYNQYGPTEASIDVTFWACKRERPQQFVPIGRPIANSQIYILDSYLQPVPIAIAGQLHIGGENLARGYLNRSDLTAEKFIPNPFSDKAGARLYKTGDLARYVPDGNIEFLGRIDDQVKIRGFRVELGEIEVALRQHPGVQDTVVMPHEYTSSDKRLVAYVVLNQQLDSNELRGFLKSKLPDYMVPSAFVFLNSLPLTLNGKVDRKALPAPDQSRSELQASDVAPRNPVEEVLAGIWAEVLKLEKVGTQDNFFDLGGHSLLATQVIARVRRAFQIDIPLRNLFEKPTVAEMAAVMTEHRVKESNEHELQSILKDLESMSDERAHKFLSELGEARPKGEVRDE